MKKFLKQVLCNAKGFTLTEALVTTLILVLASTLLATGIPVAFDTYQKTVKGANAQVALSTTITLLRSEIGSASSVIDNGDSSIYYCTDDGSWASIRNAASDDEGYGLIKSYYDGEVSSSGTVEVTLSQPLVSNAAITNDLRVSFDSWTLDNDVVKISNLRVYDVNNPDSSLACVGEEVSAPLCIFLRFA